MDEKPRPTEVVITDVEIPFLSMIVFLIKLAFAAIPAGFVAAFGYFIIAAFFSGMMGHK